MTDEARRYLVRQFDTAKKLLDFHLDGLTTEECLWRPAKQGLHVHQTVEGHWRATLEQVREEELRSTERTRWPFQGRPYGDVIVWVNVELVKNAAEIGYARFLHAARR